jgi:hypothetical protein
MKRIIPPVPVEEIEQELTEDKFIRYTNYGKNELYSVTYHDSPNVMREIARLRELTFRYAGGGTGLEMDIDKYDTADVPYSQLIVWEPIRKEILGGYRYIVCRNAKLDKNGVPELATAALFRFSEKFKRDYLPHTMELGRSFVQPNYQVTLGSPVNTRRSIFTLDNLWDGLGALIVQNPDIKYFFGKVTMYMNFNERARDMIIYFLKKYFGDKENLAEPYQSLPCTMDFKELENLFCGNSYQDDIKILSQNVRALGENIPPLINSYMNLSATMKCFGTAPNQHFGNVEETGILITINDIYDIKKDRHIQTYFKPI